MRLRLKELLEEHGYEQKDLAEELQLSTRAVSELCSGRTKRYPKETLEKIIEKFNITDMNELFEVRD
ncbi:MULTISPECIES: helix-turn-helix domain-containing protein [Bacillus]|uniref:helix-turn-helix domain-containing protein n=1 Tax=Bacillus TaxID=1386 RepID=UPI00227F01EB|nr:MULTISPECIES: helix-turn-helix transcriptional regulator [Bacillus]MCY7776626.1 helix-turn-helix transcriptional regulator [Bacillus licheniformis]MCY8531775.1 helix-turn-helix transcriptional regulator [Bacillus licheniformis]MCY9435111.1 helix-turn-helix transcriptional regulator [Bacillus haynesii]MEC0684968.1 helix-turn-helix transcriptional regulator [Bacillus haynesii]MEC1390447.1 helix-turn-helix transcriptional regulator [Bacillus licheniformis]